MQLDLTGKLAYHMGFNPHPARKPDATSIDSVDVRTIVGFQSSPGPKAGCNVRQAKWRILVVFWFQSSPGPKAGCNMMSKNLTASSTCFNPHPARKPDATFKRLGNGQAGRGFNPHPARKPDATLASQVSHMHQDVSILTRPESRMQPPAL